MASNVMLSLNDIKEEAGSKQMVGNDEERSDDIEINKALTDLKAVVPHLSGNDPEQSESNLRLHRLNPPRTPCSDEDDYDMMDDDDAKNELECLSTYDTSDRMDTISSRNGTLKKELIKGVEKGHSELIKYVNKRRDILLNEINLVKHNNNKIKPSDDDATCCKDAFKMTVYFDDGNLKKTIDQMFKLQSENQEQADDDFKKQEQVQEHEHEQYEKFYNDHNNQKHFDHSSQSRSQRRQREYYNDEYDHRTNGYYYHDDQYAAYENHTRQSYDDYIDHGVNNRNWRRKKGKRRNKGIRYDDSEYDTYGHRHDDDFEQINNFDHSQQSKEIGQNEDVQTQKQTQHTKSRWQPKKHIKKDENAPKPKKHHIYVHDTEELDYSAIRHKYADIVIISQFDANHISNNGLTLDENRTILKRTENQTHGYAMLSGKPAINGMHCWRIKCEKFKPWIFIGVCNPSRRYSDASWNNRGVWGITTCSQSNRNGDWSTDYTISRALEWKNKDLLHLDMLVDCDRGRLSFKEISECEHIDNPVTIALNGLCKGQSWIPHFNLHTFGSTVTARKIPAKRFGQIW